MIWKGVQGGRKTGSVVFPYFVLKCIGKYRENVLLQRKIDLNSRKSTINVIKSTLEHGFGYYNMIYMEFGVFPGHWDPILGPNPGVKTSIFRNYIEISKRIRIIHTILLC